MAHSSPRIIHARSLTEGGDLITDGGVTIVVIEHPEEVQFALAICRPHESYNKYLGTSVALGRLMAKRENMGWMSYKPTLDARNADPAGELLLHAQSVVMTHLLGRNKLTGKPQLLSRPLAFRICDLLKRSLLQRSVVWQLFFGDRINV